MRKLILGLAVSLDGFIEGPNGEYDWCFTDQDYGLNEFFTQIDALFVGRKTYEMSIAQDGRESWLPKLKEYVFSNTLERFKSDRRLISGTPEEVEAQVRRIKSLEGKDIWLFGGAELSNFLMELNLIDELWLSVHPVMLGAGKPFLGNLKDRHWLTLIESKVYETGLVSLKYSCKKTSND